MSWFFFFFSSRRRHTRCSRDWSSDVCSSDLDFVGLCPKPHVRIEGGGATGGVCFQQAWGSGASGRDEVVGAVGFETMRHLRTAKGKEFNALGPETNFGFPVGR